MKKAILVAGIVCLTLVIFTCGCIEQNATGNTVTLVMHTKMFDFSAGQIITEEGTTEDIDVITGADDNEVRIISRNFVNDNVVGVKVSGDEEYSYYIDVPSGTECKLKDNEGGIATFTVTAIGENADGWPTATITWSYSPAD